MSRILFFSTQEQSNTPLSHLRCAHVQFRLRLFPAHRCRFLSHTAPANVQHLFKKELPQSCSSSYRFKKFCSAQKRGTDKAKTCFSRFLKGIRKNALKHLLKHFSKERGFVLPSISRLQLGFSLRQFACERILRTQKTALLQKFLASDIHTRRCCRHHGAAHFFHLCR